MGHIDFFTAKKICHTINLSGLTLNLGESIVRENWSQNETHIINHCCILYL